MNRMLLVVVGLSWLIGPAAVGAADARQTVQVRETQVRSSPSFLSAIQGSLAYGVPVTVLESRSGWARIVAEGDLRGWVHQSALGRPRSGMRAAGGTMDTSATGDELALAGKGFSAEVEQTYRAEHADAGFAWVDRMENLAVSQEDIRQFLDRGGLRFSVVGGRP